MGSRPHPAEIKDKRQDKRQHIIMCNVHPTNAAKKLFHDLSLCTHVCGLRHPTVDLQQFFPFFSFMFGCLHVFNSNLRHTMYDLRQRFFRSGTKKTRPRTHLWPDAGCIHRQRPTTTV